MERGEAWKFATCDQEVYVEGAVAPCGLFLIKYVASHSTGFGGLGGVRRTDERMLVENYHQVTCERPSEEPKGCGIKEGGPRNTLHLPLFYQGRHAIQQYRHHCLIEVGTDRQCLEVHFVLHLLRRLGRLLHLRLCRCGYLLHLSQPCGDSEGRSRVRTGQCGAEERAGGGVRAGIAARPWRP